MAQKRIVVVDGSPDNLESLCMLLRLWGYEVEAAGDLGRALALARSRRPDAVVMDLGLPDGDALYLIRRIKADCAPVLIIAFSGWHQLEAAARAAGADAFVLKPDIDSLERLLAHHRRGPMAAAECVSVVVKKTHERRS